MEPEHGYWKKCFSKGKKRKLILFKDHYSLACWVHLLWGGEINIIITFIEPSSMATVFKNTLYIRFYGILSPGLERGTDALIHIVVV